MSKTITQKRLQELLSYDKKTGIFKWKQKRGSVNIGDTAQCRDKYGYVLIRIDKTLYKAHRLAWLYVYGTLPIENIDHINHTKDDNRIVNLREATPLENNRNQTITKANKSGVVGVCFIERINRWASFIHVNNKTIRLGNFKDKQDAIQSRLEANKHYGFHINHGVAL